MNRPDLDTIFNEVAQEEKPPLSQLAGDILHAFEDGDDTVFRNLKSQALRLPPPYRGELLYILLTTCSPDHLERLKKEYTIDLISQRAAIIRTAIAKKDLDFVRSCRDNLSKLDKTEYLMDADHDWLKNNYESVRDALDLDIHDSHFITTLDKFFKNGRFDLFRFFYEKCEDPVQGKWLLGKALQEQNREAIAYLMTPDTYKALEKAEPTERYRRSKNLLELAIKTSPDLALSIFRDLHQYNIFKGIHPYVDIDHIVKTNQISFLTGYFDLGYKLFELSLQNYIGLAAAGGHSDMLKLLLKQPGDHFEVGFNHSLTRSCIMHNHLDCLKIMHENGYAKDPSDPTIRTLIEAVTSVDTLNYLLSRGYSLPEDKRRILHSGKSFYLKYHLNRLYLYKELKERKVIAPPEDLQVLAALPLSNLRKLQVFPSGLKARGTTYATLSGHFDLVLQAAARHAHPDPFSRKDLSRADEKLKCCMIDILVAFDKVDQVFQAPLWKDREEDLKKLWQHSIPDHFKPRYEDSYRQCLTAIKIETLKPAHARPALRRRRKPR